MKPDGGQVFPLCSLSLRDLIAIVNMAARSVGTIGAWAGEAPRLAENAYKTADAMLAERAK